MPRGRSRLDRAARLLELVRSGPVLTGDSPAVLRRKLRAWLDNWVVPVAEEVVEHLSRQAETNRRCMAFARNRKNFPD